KPLSMRLLSFCSVLFTYNLPQDWSRGEGLSLTPRFICLYQKSGSSDSSKSRSRSRSKSSSRSSFGSSFFLELFLLILPSLDEVLDDLVDFDELFEALSPLTKIGRASCRERAWS